MAPSDMQLLYNELDHVIDLCTSARSVMCDRPRDRLDEIAKKLRDIRDNLPADPEDPDITRVAIMDAYGAGAVYEIDGEDFDEALCSDNLNYVKKHGKKVADFDSNYAEEMM